MNKALIFKFIASLVCVCAATAAFAHAQLEKATPASRRHGRLGDRNPPQFSEGVEPSFSGVDARGARRRSAARRSPRSKRATSAC